VQLHHVGIAVADMNDAVLLYTGRLGARLIKRARLDSLEYALIDAGPAELELLHSTDLETPTGKFLTERGPGLHHLAYAVADLEVERRRLLHEGFEQSGEVRTGVHGTPIVFFHPKSVGGVLTELVQAHV
jgi:methylmalonyl-CoA epimerase